MSEVKQVIVMRADLKMRRGKECAQAAHASMKVILDMMKISDSSIDFGDDVERVDYVLTIPYHGAIDTWLEGNFAKICVAVNSEEELMNIFYSAKEARLPCALIVDSGKTEFNGVLTKTCIAIGPWYSEEIDKVTGHLKLR